MQLALAPLLAVASTEVALELATQVAAEELLAPSWESPDQQVLAPSAWESPSSSHQAAWERALPCAPLGAQAAVAQSLEGGLALGRQVVAHHNSKRQVASACLVERANLAAFRV